MDHGFLDIKDAKLRNVLKKMSEAETYYDSPDGPSNAEKIEEIRTTLSYRDGDIFMSFPYQQVYEAENPINARAGAYLCDLRIQALKFLLDHYKDANVNLLIAIHMCLQVNIIWRVRMRTRIDLHNTVVRLNNPSSEQKYDTPTQH